VKRRRVGEPATVKVTSNSGLITATVLVTLAGIVGCGTESPTSDANASASSSESGTGADAASWCASAAAKYPKQFEGMSLKYSVTSTLAAVDAWRAEQGRAAGFQEQTRFPALASVAPSDLLGVCLFVHARRPIPQPPRANITADGTRRFVTPDGTWVDDAIGPQAVLLQEMEQIH
jgi:hypothetical protein